MSIAARLGARAYSREDPLGLEHFATFGAALDRDRGFAGSFVSVAPRSSVAALAADESWVSARLRERASAAAAAVRPTQPEPIHNGGTAGFGSMAATGNQAVDALLSTVKWNTVSLTYADTDAASDYQSGYRSDDNGNGTSAQNEGFSRLSARELVVLHFSLNARILTQPSGAAGFSVAGFSSLNISYAAADGAANIRVANSSDPRTSYASYPDAGIYAGDAFIGTSARTPTAGNYAWYTIMHEIGHTLGLKHGHETQGYGALPAAYDSHEYSIMTYKSYIGSDISSTHWEEWGAPQTFMMLDIAALQAMYGAQFGINSGNTTYSWSPTRGETYVNGNLAIDPGGNRVFMTVWDGGGIDTYDLSNYSSNLEIDLEPGGFSDFNSGQSSYLGGGPNGGYARGNVFNALLYQGDFRSLIENATGGRGNDLISGNSANNTLRGNAGNDDLYGYAGNDVLYGGDGNDVLIVGAGNGEEAYGEGGDDIISWSPPDPSAPRTMDGGVGGTDSIHGGGTNFGFVTFNLGAGTYKSSTGVTETWSNFENYDNGLASGNETVIGTVGKNTLQTGAGDNILDGAFGEDILLGGAGEDVIFGGFSKDTIYGQEGNDVIVVRDGEYVDNVDGGEGTDTLDVSGEDSDGIVVDMATGVWTGSYNPTSVTITGIETINGTQVGDTITGDGATNVFHGNGGNDVLNGGGGPGDQLYGDAGNDRICWGPPTPSAARTADGGDGIDTIDGGGITFGGTTFNLAAGTSSTGSSTETWANFENYFNNGIGSEIVIGTSIANVIMTGSGNNSLSGGDGDDTLDGGRGDDTLDGGDGIDIADFSTAAAGVVISAQVTTAQSNAGAGVDTLVSIEALIGSAFDDVLTGTGNLGGFVRGGDGDDYVYAAIGADDLNGGAGLDTVDGSLFLGNYMIDLATGITNFPFESIINFENVTSGAGDDTLIGTDGTNVLNGGAGNDTLAGGLGNDRLIGGAGTDIADYSANATRVKVDLARTDVQNTLGAGNDKLSEIEGVRGSAFNDLLIGNTGANPLDGGAGNDTVRGGDGIDRLLGGDGIDHLIGGAGNDTLIGGPGKDYLTGSGGRDIFAFSARDAVGDDNDTVIDFAKAIDTVDLSAISKAIGQTLSFIADAAFSGADGELRFRITGGDTRLLIDLDGDKLADFTVRFTGEIAFTTADFILI